MKYLRNLQPVRELNDWTATVLKKITDGIATRTIQPVSRIVVFGVEQHTTPTTRADAGRAIRVPLVRRELATSRKHVFVIGGSKALKAAFRLPAKEGTPYGEPGRVAGAPISERGGELARRLGVNVHGQSAGVVAELGTLSGFNQRRRKSPQRRAITHAARLSLAGREDGAALGCHGSTHERREFSQNYGLPGFMDAGSGFGRKERSRSGEGGVMILRQSRRLYGCWPLKGA